MDWILSFFLYFVGLGALNGWLNVVKKVWFLTCSFSLELMGKVRILMGSLSKVCHISNSVYLLLHCIFYTLLILNALICTVSSQSELVKSLLGTEVIHRLYCCCVLWSHHGSFSSWMAMKHSLLLQFDYSVVMMVMIWT